MGDYTNYARRHTHAPFSGLSKNSFPLKSDTEYHRLGTLNNPRNIIPKHKADNTTSTISIHSSIFEKELKGLIKYVFNSIEILDSCEYIYKADIKCFTSETLYVGGEFIGGSFYS